MLRDEATKGTPPAKYLNALIRGGRRRHKGFEKALIRAGIMRSDEYAVPGDDIRLNRFGNIPKGQFTKMLSQLKASPDAMQNATGSARSRAGRRGAAFFTMPGFRGVMRRTGKRSMTVFLAFVKAPSYRKRLRFFETIDGVAKYRLKREFDYQLRKALRTAR